MKNIRNIKIRIIVICAGVFSAAMVIFPQITEESSKAAMLIWANSIVPVLLPFFIFSDFIKKTGSLARLPAGIYPVAVAFLSGYPMGAKATADFISSNKVSVNQGKHILSYSMVTGPAFILFTVGTFIGSTKAAVLITFSHYTAALINGFFYGEKGPVINSRKDQEEQPIDILGNFTAAIGDGFRSMAIILAYLMMFTIAANIFEHLNLFSVLESPVSSSFIKGIFEMTIGTNMVGMCDISVELKAVLSSFLVSFGGLSVIAQSVSMLSGCGISIGEIFKIKLTHGIIAAILTTILVNIVII